MRKLVSPRSILIVSLVGFTISIGIGLNEIYRHRLALDAQYKINAWLITQAELEMQRLVHTLDRYFSEVEPASHGDLAMRFDLFWSRLPVLLTGSQSEALRNVPGLEATILRIQADLEAIEKQILSLRPDDVVTYQAIRSRLMSHTGPLHDVVLAAIEHDSAKIEAERHAFRARYWQVGLSLFGALAGGAIFIGLLIRETRRTRHLLQVATAAEREAREARARLHEAIESISEGFMFYGADRKLLIANRKLRDIYFSISEMIVPGAAFDQLAIEAAYRGQYAGFTDPADAGRVDLFDFEAEGDHTIEMSDGRWIRVTRYATTGSWPFSNCLRNSARPARISTGFSCSRPVAAISATSSPMAGSRPKCWPSRGSSSAFPRGASWNSNGDRCPMAESSSLLPTSPNGGSPKSSARR